MSDVLRGNFKVRNPVGSSETAGTDDDRFKAEFRKKALESISGSMVFVEREKLFWDDEAPKDKS